MAGPFPYDGPSMIFKTAKEVFTMRAFPFHLVAVLLFLFTSGEIARAEEEKKDPAKEAPVKIRYRPPEIMLVTSVDWPASEEHRETMAKFLVEKGINCVEGATDVLDVCRRNGLYVRVGARNGDLGNLLQEIKDLRLKDDPAVFGYFISDRRRSSAFATWARWVQLFEERDPKHPAIFINRALWNEFGQFADVVKPMILDFYHYHWDGKRKPDRYHLYLHMFRDVAKKHGIPVMRCVGTGVSPPQLLQTMYVSLAYGVQAFHFWVPWHVGHQKDEKGPILKDGKLVPTITPWGETIGQFGKDMRAMGPTLLKSTSLATYYTEPFPQYIGKKIPEELWFTATGGYLVIGHFQDKEKEDYLLVVNSHVGQDQKAEFTFKAPVSSAQWMDKKTGKWKRAPGKGLATSLTIKPGSGELLWLQKKKAP
ncbi:MAG: hypothetical protein CMJ99_06830 [Planctomycetes bacterium]|nr:hypothetical protein [Planctomycetota bacterium]